MNKFFDKALRVLTRINTWVVLITALFTFIASHYNFLFIRITIPIWLLVLCVIAPYLAFYLFRWCYHRKKRQYKTGDAVGIIADNRKFIVIRYHFWLPLTAVCKEENRNTIIAVHQSYLTPYQEKNKNIDDMINSITNPYHSLAVGTILKHL